MFARFGREARQVIELAEDHARALWRPAVGPEHLLLALLAVDDTGVFVRAGLRFDDVRARLLDTTTAEPQSNGAAQRARHLPLRLRSVFRDAFRRASALGSPEVTPLHLALALVEEPPGEVLAVLRALKVKVEEVRDVVTAQILDGETGADGEDSPPVRLVSASGT